MIEVGGDGRFKKYRAPVKEAAERTLFFLKKKGSISIFLVGNKVMKKNVLAFPAVSGFPRPDTALPFLGEIYLNPSYIAKEAFEIKNSAAGKARGRGEVGDKVLYMLIHGILHLLGYDHIKTRDRIRMEAKEMSVLRLIQK